MPVGLPGGSSSLMGVSAAKLGMWPVRLKGLMRLPDTKTPTRRLPVKTVECLEAALGHDLEDRRSGLGGQREVAQLVDCADVGNTAGAAMRTSHTEQCDPLLDGALPSHGEVSRQGAADPRAASCSITASRSLSRFRPLRAWPMRGFVASRSRFRCRKAQYPAVKGQASWPTRLRGS